MGDGQRIALYSVVAHQQPSRQALVDVMDCVAYGGVGELDRKGLNGADDDLPKVAVLLHRDPEVFIAHAVGFTIPLHADVMGAAVNTGNGCRRDITFEPED